MPVLGVLFLLAAGALSHIGQLGFPAALALAIGARVLGDTPGAPSRHLRLQAAER